MDKKQHSVEIFPCSSLELPQYYVGNVERMSLVEADKSMEFRYTRNLGIVRLIIAKFSIATKQC